MGLAETAQLAVRIDLAGNASTGIDKLQRKVNGLGKSVGRVGKGFGQVGAGIARIGAIAGTVAVGGLVASAKAVIDWQDAFAGVVKTVDEADLSKAGLTFRDIEMSLRKMATEMPNSAIELAGIAEAAGAMGIAGKDIEAFTRQVAIMASTTNISAEQGAVALGQMQNIIALLPTEFRNFTASLVELGNAGNSTESAILEIARRSGGAAKLFGIAKDATLGWAAAAANLGLNEELAGTALQNVFIKLLPKFIQGSKELQEVTGQTGKELKAAYAKDAGGAVESLIKKLGTLPKAARLEAVQELFGKTSGITRLVLGLAESFDKNLAPSLDTATKSWEEATAAEIEFEKRNATVKSAISRLRNGILDAAITIGEGFAPALGRSAEKLAEFLKAGNNQSQLKAIGVEIGKAIDGIQWDRVLDGARDFVGVLKGALSVAKTMWDGFNALPDQVKASVAALLVLNKASGGMVAAGVGNIVGGLAETIIRGLGSKLPGVGALFAQPVFVTNWPLGGIGGGIPGGGGLMDTLKNFLKIAIPAAVIVGATSWVQDNVVMPDLNKQAGSNITGTNDIIARGNVDELRASIRGLQEMPGQLDPLQRVLYDLNASGVKVHTESLIAAMTTALTAAEAKGRSGGLSPDERQERNDQRSSIGPPTPVSVPHRHGVDGRRIAEITPPPSAAVKTFDTAIITANQSRTAGELKQSVARSADTTRTGSASIVSAIYANRPNVQVTVNVSGSTVTKTIVKKERYGPSGGSRNRDALGSTGALTGGR